VYEGEAHPHAAQNPVDVTAEVKARCYSARMMKWYRSGAGVSQRLKSTSMSMWMSLARGNYLAGVGL